MWWVDTLSAQCIYGSFTYCRLCCLDQLLGVFSSSLRSFFFLFFFVFCFGNGRVLAGCCLPLSNAWKDELSWLWWWFSELFTWREQLVNWVCSEPHLCFRSRSSVRSMDSMEILQSWQSLIGRDKSRCFLCWSIANSAEKYKPLSQMRIS